MPKHVEPSRPQVTPNGRHHCADGHGRAVHRRRNDKRQRHDHHVRPPRSDPYPVPRQQRMPDQNHRHADGGEDEREGSTRRGDRKGGIGDGHGDGTPGRDGGDVEGAGGGGCVVDAGVGGGEEHKGSGGNEDGTGGSKALGEPLKFGRGPEEKADTEVAGEI